MVPVGVRDSARVAGVAFRSGDAELIPEPGLPRTEAHPKSPQTLQEDTP